jgi:hypothetical protein
MPILRQQTPFWNPAIEKLIQTTLSDHELQSRIQDKEEKIRKESEEIKKQTSVNFLKLHEQFTI